MNEKAKTVHEVAKLTGITEMCIRDRMFSLQSGDSQSMGSRIMRRPRMLMHSYMHRLQHKLGRSMAALGAGMATYLSLIHIFQEIQADFFIQGRLFCCPHLLERTDNMKKIRRQK